MNLIALNEDELQSVYDSYNFLDDGKFMFLNQGRDVIVLDRYERDDYSYTCAFVIHHFINRMFAIKKAYIFTIDELKSDVFENNDYDRVDSYFFENIEDAMSAFSHLMMTIDKSFNNSSRVSQVQWISTKR